LDEIKSLRKIASGPQSQLSDLTADYTLGIYQSIGYKEFHHYLESTPSELAYKDAVERMKISTRQYAKRQISWIRNKLLPAVYAANQEETLVPFYLLDATELGEGWRLRVQDPAIRITQDFLIEGTLPDPLSLSDIARKMLSINEKPVDPTSVLNARRLKICSVCTDNDAQPVMIEEGLWDLHRNSRVHRRLTSRATKKHNSASGSINDSPSDPLTPVV